MFLTLKLIFSSIYIQHSQCPCRCLLSMERKALFVVTNYETDARCRFSRVTWPCSVNVNSNEHEGETYASEHNRLFAPKSNIISIYIHTYFPQHTTYYQAVIPCVCMTYILQEGMHTPHIMRDRSITHSFQIFVSMKSSISQL